MSDVIVKPETLSYATLCKHYSAFIVPKFQRLYSWKNKQIQNFFSSIIENEKGYFVGTMVGFCEEPNEAGSSLYLVDGQQRITTINLLLIAIRSILKESFHESDAEKLKRDIELLLKSIEMEGSTSRFVPGKENLKNIYMSLLNEEKLSKPDSQQRIYLKNYGLLFDLSSDFIRNDILKVEELLGKIRYLKFIPIICKTESDVQSIYEGLNSTGLPLSISDLVKNKVISACQDDHREEVEEKWEEIENCFSKVDFSLLPKFLRHNWISEYGYINTKDLYQEIIRVIIKNNSANKYVSQLLDDSRIYLGLYGVSDYHGAVANLFRNQNNILKILKNFQYLGNMQVYSVLLAFIKNFKDTRRCIRPKILISSLDKLWNFCFRSQYVSINPSSYEKIFSNICKILKSSNPNEISNKIQEEFKKLSRLVSNRSQFVQYFADDLSYVNDRKLIEIIFSKIFEAEQYEIVFSDQSVEHIVPQTPKKWGFEKRDIKDFVHNIGNLTLLHPKDNTLAKNEKFDIKYEKIYKKSVFAFNKKLKKYAKKFNEDPKRAVLDRSKDIAILVERLFKV